jgi:hypothetical protein
MPEGYTTHEIDQSGTSFKGEQIVTNCSAER